MTFLILKTKTIVAEILVIELARIKDQSFLYMPYIVHKITPITNKLYMIKDMSLVFLLLIILKA